MRQYRSCACPVAESIGVTLIELLLVLVIASILIAMGMPAFQKFASKNRIVEAGNTLVGHLNYTRNEAISRAVEVSICASADGMTCANSMAWETGWIVFTDEDGGGTIGDLDPGDEILRAYQNDEGRLSIALDGSFIRFGPSGKLKPD